MLKCAKLHDLEYNASALPRAFKMTPKTILLHRKNREKDEQRFYWLSIGSSLVDGLAVLRVWGRIGGHQHRMVTPFESETEAQKLFNRLLGRRLRGGYTVIKGNQNG